MNKIVRVEAFPMQYPEPNNDNKIRYVTLARIETSDGIVGWGWAVTAGSDDSRLTSERACQKSQDSSRAQGRLRAQTIQA